MFNQIICRYVKRIWSYMTLDTECPYWDQVSVSNTKLNLFFSLEKKSLPSPVPHTGEPLPIFPSIINGKKVHSGCFPQSPACVVPSYVHFKVKYCTKVVPFVCYVVYNKYYGVLFVHCMRCKNVSCYYVFFMRCSTVSGFNTFLLPKTGMNWGEHMWRLTILALLVFFYTFHMNILPSVQETRWCFRRVLGYATPWFLCVKNNWKKQLKNISLLNPTLCYKRATLEKAGQESSSHKLAHC